MIDFFLRFSTLEQHQEMLLVKFYQDLKDEKSQDDVGSSTAQLRCRPWSCRVTLGAPLLSSLLLVCPDILHIGVLRRSVFGANSGIHVHQQNRNADLAQLRQRIRAESSQTHC
jgi:hypothetical protein